MFQKEIVNLLMDLKVSSLIIKDDISRVINEVNGKYILFEPGSSDSPEFLVFDNKEQSKYTTEDVQFKTKLKHLKYNYDSETDCIIFKAWYNTVNNEGLTTTETSSIIAIAPVKYLLDNCITIYEPVRRR